jgi:mannose-6-phosphate isomerase-like protein (cupin superfamily)
MKIVALKNLSETTTVHNAGMKKQMIGRGEIPSLMQFAQVIFQPGEKAKAHKHNDMYEVFFVEEGNGTMEIGSENFSLKKGMCITVSPQECHEIINTGINNLILTYFGIATTENK